MQALAAARALLLDLDGTLADSLTIAWEVYSEIIKAYGGTPTEAEFQEFNGVPLLGCCRRLRDRLALEDDPSDMARKWLDLFESSYPSVRPCEGAAELFTRARGNGWRIAVVTSGARKSAEAWLGRNGLVADTVVGSTCVADGKPSPEPYLEAMRRLSVAPRDCIAIEDSENGVRAATSSGALTFMLTKGAMPRGKAWPLRSLGEIHGLLGYDYFLRHKFTSPLIRSNAVAPPLRRQDALEIDRIWTEEKQRRPDLFDGTLFSRTRTSEQEIESYFIPYRRMLAARSNVEIAEALDIRPLAVSALSECRDGLILGRRSRGVTEMAGQWEFAPSGGVTAEDVSSDGLVNVRAALETELQQELGIDRALVSSFAINSGFENAKTRLLDLVAEVTIDVSRDEVLERHAALTTKEYDEISIVPADRLLDFCSSVSWALADVTFQIAAARSR